MRSDIVTGTEMHIFAIGPSISPPFTPALILSPRRYISIFFSFFFRSTATNSTRHSTERKKSKREQPPSKTRIWILFLFTDISRDSNVNLISIYLQLDRFTKKKTPHKSELNFDLSKANRTAAKQWEQLRCVYLHKLKIIFFRVCLARLFDRLSTDGRCFCDKFSAIRKQQINEVKRLKCDHTHTHTEIP